MARILAIRLNALGDVAISLPVLYSFAKHFPEHELIFLTNKRFESLFYGAPANFRFVGADLKDEHRTIFGLFRLFKQLKALNINAVADLHNVMRSQIIRFLFSISGIKTVSRKKETKERQQLVRRKNKVMKELKPYYQRFAEVFYSLGYNFPIDFTKLTKNFPVQKENKKWIGVAPFAATEMKMYPLELMEKVVCQLAKDDGKMVFLLGGGKNEVEILSDWEKKYQNVVSVAGKYPLDTELGLMQQLDLMLCMDSANMHLASLVGTPVISIWGPTHPFVGFRPWNQPNDNQIQLDLPCRPCSEWGSFPCYKKHFGCMNWITPEQILKKIEENLL